MDASELPDAQQPATDQPTPDTPPNAQPAIDEFHLVRWGEALAGIARTGLSFTENLYEQERYHEVLKLAAEIRAAAADRPAAQGVLDEWMRQTEPGAGVAGYVTPKVSVGAIVGNDAGELLLIKRADSGVWLFPTGWADVGYVPAEIAVKEVWEETGVRCEPIRLIAVLDAIRQRITRQPFYSLVFLCRALGGTPTPHPLECLEARYFSEADLPESLTQSDTGKWWVSLAFRAIRGEVDEVAFQPPNVLPWEEEEAEEETS